MGWKKRRNGRTYYYRSVRTGTCVRSEYVGAGVIGELSAERDRGLAQLAQLERKAWAAEVMIASASAHEIMQWCADVRSLVYTTLRSWGYHEQKRVWRLARRKVDTMEVNGATEARVVTRERVNELIKAQRLTSAQEDELEVGLKSFPFIVNNLGDLGALLRRQLISTMTQQPGVGVVWNAKVQTLRNELGYADAAPSERLVIDTIVTCWLHLQAVEMDYQNFCRVGGTLAQVATWEGRLSAALKRFSNQVELLAKLRYWGSRVHQVNIAQNMIVSNG